MTRRLWFPHVLALLGYAALVVLVTWPTLPNFFTRITGNLIPDRDQNLWNLWWVREALLVRHTNPFHTDLLYYPYGVELYLHDLALPNGLIALGPYLLFGIFAAYNTVVLASYLLSGYAAFRMVWYCLGRTASTGVAGDRWVRFAAAFLGGIIFAFTAYSLDAQKQINILALEWVPFAAEAWLRAWDGGKRGWAAAAAVFTVLAMLVNSYYEVLLVLFMAAYVVYRVFRPDSIFTSAGGPALLRERVRATVWRGLRLALPFVVPAALLGGPYALGVWNSLHTQHITAEATAQQSIHAADLLSFVLPAPDHLWLGESAPWWQKLDPNVVPGYLGLGVVALLLAAAGAWVARRRDDTLFWGLLALGAALLAMGTTLSIGGRRLFFGHEIPLPFALIGQLPIFNLIGKVERFEILTLLALAVLGGRACVSLLTWLAAGRPHGWVRAGAGAVVVGALLLAELPLHDRSTRVVTQPPGVAALAQDPVQGPILELPFIQVRVVPLAKRMWYQTGHDRPLLAAYISRTVENKNALPCSPLYRFARPLDVPVTDIVSPATAAQPLAVLHSLGIGTVVQYARYDVESGPLVDPGEARAIGALVREVVDGPPFYQDDIMTIYHVRAGATLTGPSLAVGDGWHDMETQGDQPFRWVDGGAAGLCVYTPTPARVTLTGEATSLAQPRTLDLQQDGQTIYHATVPSGDFLHLQTPVLTLPAGSTELHLLVPEGAQPAGPNDPRRVSIGLRNVRVVPQP